MRYEFTADEQEVHGSLRKLLAARCPLKDAIVERPAGRRYDADLWTELCVAGWIEALSSAVGDLSMPGMVAAAEEFGRKNPRIPWSTVCGYVLPLVAELSNDHASRYAAMIGSGQVVTAAVAPSLNASTPLQLHEEAERVVVIGRLERIPFAQHAAAVIAVARNSAGEPVLVAVPLRADGVELADVATADLTKDFASVELTRAQADVLGRYSPELDADLRSAWLRHSLFLSAEAVGGLDELVGRAISYVTDRKQFGSPVGSFQAVKHIIANAATSLHNGRAVTYLAASSVERNDDSADHDVACARLFTGEHYLRGSEQLIQVHGGFGFTWEAGIHLWYRNAMANMHQPDRPADLASLRL